WAEGATLRVSAHSGEQAEDENAAERPVPASTYVAVRRRWAAGDVVELSLPLTVRFVEADERIDAVRGCVAIERGPLVYAVEQVDQGDGVVVDDLSVDPSAPASVEHR